MPKGPQGQKRPADVIGNAVHVMKILTGEIEDTIPTPESEGKDPAAVTLGRKRGKARAEGLSKTGLSETVLGWADIVAAIDAEAPAQKRGPYENTGEQISN